MHLSILVVGVSTLLQAAAGVLALRLIPITHHRWPWGLVALGFCGMALRRAMSLFSTLTLGDSPVLLSLPFEILGLVTSVLMLWGVAIVGPVFREAQAARASAEQTAQELQSALNNIKVLHGILPTCAWCKKIRDDAGQWQQIEEYVRQRTEAEFSHGICPDCMKRLYPHYCQQDQGGITPPPAETPWPDAPERNGT